jgi:hypothetical protein
MQMKRRLLYLLIFLVISAQVDNYWTVRPVLLSASLVDEDDEYISSERQMQVEESSARQAPMFFGMILHTADISFVPRRLSSEWNQPKPFPPAPYVLMSMQI